MEPTWLLFSGSLYDKTETLFTTGLMLDLSDQEITHITDITHFTHAQGVGRKANGWAKKVIDDATATVEEEEASREESEGVQLIRDCISAVNSQTKHDFFHNTMVPTTARGNKIGGWGLYDAVLALPETQWSIYNFGNKPLTVRRFCKTLKIRGIKRPKGDNVTIDGHPVKG
jgi:hypothetical protein